MPLPQDVRAYGRTPESTEATAPEGLKRAHDIKPGVWGLIHLLEGRLTYHVTDPRRAASEAILTPATATGVVEPTIRYEVEPLGPVRFSEFHR